MHECQFDGHGFPLPHVSHTRTRNLLVGADAPRDVRCDPIAGRHDQERLLHINDILRWLEAA
eukprot:3421214-Pyramimonas_sp.AAC.1